VADTLAEKQQESDEHAFAFLSVRDVPGARTSDSAPGLGVLRIGRTFEGGDELIDAKGLVQDKAESVLARLDDGMRGVIAIGGHKDYQGFGLGFTQAAIGVITGEIG